MAAPNVNRPWIKIGPHKYINAAGDTVVFLDKDTALINDIRVRGHNIIHAKIRELSGR
ncbi:hypothetical protein Q4E93_09960 [Flavitalea sp. BT771]|uniref:hypothetical protein n=1 Tax=Flavitalea sp. BT771 TaxID=3063329 RepID=UPI0026E37C0D|nr:hypothetical protein [Flavitalea sp. BT771]MDO6430912.1 hypothetical protein [Flavitalea sp. BT771]MDV6218948.1 hypothetical protein [Flavitalea sp. BT771]